MSLNTQKAHTKALWRQQRHNFAAALMAMSAIETSTATRTLVIYTATMYCNATMELPLLNARTKEINSISCVNNFANLTNPAGV